MSAAATIRAATGGAATAAVEARSLYRFFRIGDEETLALQGVSLSVGRGEFVAVAGPSGSGKSTLLACLAGMDEPQGGSVHIAGERISHRSEWARARLRAGQVGVLFQTANLFEHLTVEQNLALVRRLAGRGATANSDQALTDVGLTARRTAYPSQLSGGELARAGLAVAVANEPVLLLADEPTGELDSGTEAQILRLLGAAARRGIGIVVASHSPAVAAAADRVIHLADGKVVT